MAIVSVSIYSSCNTPVTGYIRHFVPGSSVVWLRPALFPDRPLRIEAAPFEVKQKIEPGRICSITTPTVWFRPINSHFSSRENSA